VKGTPREYLLQDGAPHHLHLIRHLGCVWMSLWAESSPGNEAAPIILLESFFGSCLVRNAIEGHENMFRNYMETRKSSQQYSSFNYKMWNKYKIIVNLKPSFWKNNILCLKYMFDLCTQVSDSHKNVSSWKKGLYLESLLQCKECLEFLTNWCSHRNNNKKHTSFTSSHF
jgi:hypothetical protein